MNDDWKNFEPRRNAPSIAKERQDVCPTCKREKRPVIDYNDAEAVRRLANHQLIAIIDVDKPTIAHTAPLRELVDRLDGKAPQSIAMTVKTPGIKQLSAMQILDARNMAARYLNQEPLVIAPEPVIIEND